MAVAFIEAVRKPTPADVVSKDVLLQTICQPAFVFQLFQKLNGHDVVVVPLGWCSHAKAVISDLMVVPLLRGNVGIKLCRSNAPARLRCRRWSKRFFFQYFFRLFFLRLVVQMIFCECDEVIEGHTIKAFRKVRAILELNICYLTVVRIKHQTKVDQIRMSVKLNVTVLHGRIGQINVGEV